MPTASAFPGVEIHDSACVDSPCEIGPGTRVWHFCHVMAGSRIGRDCSLGQNVMVASDVVVGDGVRIQNNVSLYTGVELEDYVFCGPSMVFTNVRTPRCEVPRKDEFLRTRVGRGTSLGANCTVVCGVDIGRYALIGAGAVVASDVPDYALILGVPGRRAGWACRCGETLPRGASGPELQCARCGNRYRDEGEKLVPVEEKQA